MIERREQPFLNKDEFFSKLQLEDVFPVFSTEQLNIVRDQMTESDFEKYYTLLYKFENSLNEKLEIDINQIIRPKLLFHASQNGDIEIFEPRAEKKRHDDDPAQVFGSPLRSISSFFIVPNDDRVAASGRWGNDLPWTFVIGDPERFHSLDKGGWMYSMPTESFSVDPNKGLGLFEWTSTKSVAPLDKIYYDSGLKAMLDFGVTVYSMEPLQFEEFRLAKEQREILEKLEPLSL